MKLPNNMRVLALITLMGSSFSLAACGGDKLPPAPSVMDATIKGQMVADTPVMTGQPFVIQGVQYVPADTANYDAVGYASWYGEEREGQNTANGEPFQASWISASHKTLPIPSYVEVTSLDTGRTILVRVNDRGPMVNDRLIDLSEGAARLLGITNTGTAAVRVRRVNPSLGEREVLRSGGQAPARLDTPPSLLTVLNKKLEGQKGSVQIGGVTTATTASSSPGSSTKPASKSKAAASPKSPAVSKTPAPVQSTATHGGYIVENVRGAKTQSTASASKPVAAPKTMATRSYYVQVASFSDESRAKAAAGKTGGRIDKAGSLYRVRSGPYESETAANEALARARKAGFRDARVFSEAR